MTKLATLYPTIPNDIAAFLAEPHPIRIMGCEQRSHRTIDVYDPSYGRVITQIAAGDSADVDAAVAAAGYALMSAEWRRMATARRAELIWKLSDLILRDREKLGFLDAIDCGLPLKHTTTHEIDAMVEDLRYYSGWATKIDGRTLRVGIPGYRASTVVEPVGVCAAITSWNFPLEAFSGKVAPVLATGCTVVLKPAEKASLSALWLAKLVEEAGFPPGVVTVVTGDAATGNALISHPGVAKVAFTGSTDVGTEIAVAAAAGLKRMSLELGGKSAVVIDSTADLNRAVAAAADSVFDHSGQNCVAGSRLLLQRDIAEHVIELLCERAQRRVQGPALEPNIDVGPVISAEQQKRILGYIDRAEQAGAELVLDGRYPDRVPSGGWYVGATVIRGVEPTHEVMQDEIFGPVVCVETYGDLDEAIALANSTHYGLAASIWTSQIGAMQQFTDEVEAGTVWVNGHTLYDSAASFGGLKASGYGRELGAESLADYTRVRTIWQGA